jgi:hypothetical protein
MLPQRSTLKLLDAQLLSIRRCLSALSGFPPARRMKVKFQLRDGVSGDGPTSTQKHNQLSTFVLLRSGAGHCL